MMILQDNINRSRIFSARGGGSGGWRGFAELLIRGAVSVWIAREITTVKHLKLFLTHWLSADWSEPISVYRITQQPREARSVSVQVLKFIPILLAGPCKPGLGSWRPPLYTTNISGSITWVCAERAALARSKPTGDARNTIRSHSWHSGMALSWCQFCMERTAFALPRLCQEPPLLYGSYRFSDITVHLVPNVEDVASVLKLTIGRDQAPLQVYWYT